MFEFCGARGAYGPAIDPGRRDTHEDAAVEARVARLEGPVAVVRIEHDREPSSRRAGGLAVFGRGAVTRPAGEKSPTFCARVANLNAMRISLWWCLAAAFGCGGSHPSGFLATDGGGADDGGFPSDDGGGAFKDGGASDGGASGCSEASKFVYLKSPLPVP